MKFAVPKLGQADEKKVNAARARWTKHFSARTGLVESATRVLVIPIFGTIPRHASTEWPECSGHCPLTGATPQTQSSGLLRRGETPFPWTMSDFEF
jgi:hypothetical protein